MDITTPLIQALLEEQFPDWAELPIVPVDRQGNDNRTFRLGDRLSVRLPSSGAYASAIAKEDHVLQILSAHLTTPLPDVVATGAPSGQFPHPWSVRRWLPGTVLADTPEGDRHQLAADLGRFLVQLRSVPTDGGPACGEHSFFRGCHPSVYSDQVQRALTELGDRVDQAGCHRIWQEALTSAWPHQPVWFHGDVAEGNLLVRGTALAAVIDFGTCGVGDPACDYVVAWTVFDPEERNTFRAAVDVDDHTWARARGWALWKALVTTLEPTSTQYQAQRKALANLIVAP